MHQLSTVEQIFGELVQAEPSRPFVTFYDESAGLRSELSVRSLANWVVKTHHLLIDELGLGPGDAAFVDLPQHWTSVPVLLACATAGLSLTDQADDGAVAFLAVQSAGELPAGLDVFSVDPAAAAVGRTGQAAGGRRDYTEAVRPHPDTWASLSFEAGDDDEFIDGQSRADYLRTAGVRATELGFGPGARVLSTRSWRGAADWLDALFAPLAVRGSLVYLADADEALVERRSGQERATARI